ncbi:unnamed protein product [Trichobilharzia szidati]|nr:unnamed protein product [Trichobilharzia szidati]
MPEAIFCDVLVLGAGISGLGAAKLLTNEGLKTIVLEARPRNGGRIHTVDLPGAANETTKFVVDLGASYLHGCNNSQEIQPLFTLAGRLKITTAPAAGDILGAHRGWECPEVAVWRDNKSGKEIGLTEVADMSFLLDRCLLHILMTANRKKQGNQSNKTLATALPNALESCLQLLYKAGHRASPTLSRREKGIFDSLFARYIAYVNPAHRLSPHLSLGPHFEADAMAGLALDVNQPTPMAKRLYLDWLEEKRTHLSLHGPNKGIARRTDHQWEDRLVLDGFSKFVDFLASDVVVHNQCVVRHVYWPSHSDFSKINETVSMQSIDESAASLNAKSLMDYIESSNLVCVETVDYTEESSAVKSSKQSCRRYFARFCIITVPVGVLKGLDRRSAIQFHPRLPPRKRLAIDRLGIPKIGAETHNKVILKFNQSEIFWDRNAAHITCPGAYLHILNCDFYGNPGVLVAHVWGGSKLKITGRSDQVVVKNLLDLLGGMYPSQCPLPEPIFTHVTRWSEDPFSLGAYTAGEVGSNDEDRQAYASPLPSTGCPKLLFAGEGTVDSSGGQQCTHGAFSSGVDRALDILDCIQGGRCRLRDVRIIDCLTGRLSDRFPPHEMVRRAKKRKLMNVMGVRRSSSTVSSDRKSSCKQELSMGKGIQSKHELRNTESSDSQSSECYSSSSTPDLESSDPYALFPKPTRRSTRLTTWISSQASSSLRREFLLMFKKKRHVKRRRTDNSNSNRSSSSSRFCSIDSSNDSNSSSEVNKVPSFSCYEKSEFTSSSTTSVPDLSSNMISSSSAHNGFSNIRVSSPAPHTSACMLLSNFHENFFDVSQSTSSTTSCIENNMYNNAKDVLLPNVSLGKHKVTAAHSDATISTSIIDHIKPTNFEPVFGALPFTLTCDNNNHLEPRVKSFSFEEALKANSLSVTP